MLLRTFRRLRLIAGSTAAAGLLGLSPGLAGAQDDGRNHAAIEAMRAGDADAALAIRTELAERGDPVAQGNLGGLLLTDVLGAPDYEQALSWFHKAAEQDYTAALVSLGHTCTGRGRRTCSHRTGRRRSATFAAPPNWAAPRGPTFSAI